MDYRCYHCGKNLKSTGPPPSWMTPLQWYASKLGDFFADCEYSHYPTGCCYFWLDDLFEENYIKRVNANVNTFFTKLDKDSKRTDRE